MRQVCMECGNKEARYVVRPKSDTRRRTFNRRHRSHDLCKRCWTATLNRAKASRL